MWFITNVGRSVDGKIVGELLPLEVKDAEDWFIRNPEGESFEEEYRLLKKGKGISSRNQPWMIMEL